ncbi:unnamed protein product [Acanthoscelides obtectus]|uniref:Uncharacterized protein n=1 Tax=Acanthoscelides obtectus TaxID=200917 RepID=A0A9P0K156_ACAOB|nr:unnamed protein product [Acanthoscelides obtectus]CAK1649386.1 hypothetical protein AOBTE_LOCUS16206 [Acanthoscelides obtectus]
MGDYMPDLWLLLSGIIYNSPYNIIRYQLIGGSQTKRPTCNTVLCRRSTHSSYQLRCCPRKSDNFGNLLTI